MEILIVIVASLLLIGIGYCVVSTAIKFFNDMKHGGQCNVNIIQGDATVHISCNSIGSAEDKE